MDPRKILGVELSATREEIQRAYRQKVTKYHPDMGGDAWVFQQVNDAYKQLIHELDGTTPTLGSKTKNQTKSPPPASRESQNSRRKHQARQAPNESPGRSQQNGKVRQPAGRSAGGKISDGQPVEFGDQRRPTPQVTPVKIVWRKLVSHQLPLQDETTTFLLVNVLDIFLTYILLRFGAVEANPFAKYFYDLWEFHGMIVFKLVIVAFVCLIAQFIAISRPQTARWLLITGTAIVSAVVAYSVWLFLNKIL